MGRITDLNGITMDIDPTIVQLGHFALRWYILLVVLAIIGGAWLGLREARFLPRGADLVPRATGGPDSGPGGARGSRVASCLAAAGQPLPEGEGGVRMAPVIGDRGDANRLPYRGVAEMSRGRTASLYNKASRPDGKGQSAR